MNLRMRDRQTAQHSAGHITVAVLTGSEKEKFLADGSGVAPVASDQTNERAAPLVEGSPILSNGGRNEPDEQQRHNHLSGWQRSGG